MKNFQSSAEIHTSPGVGGVAHAPVRAPRPPVGLSKASRTWWKRLFQEYHIEDAGGLLVLETALRAHDRMVEARERLNAEGLTVTDRFGQPKPHPCAVIERDSRAAMLASLRALNLEIEPPFDRLGRPGRS